ncbi:hypothetical protein WICPIJ_006272 [Wickerhamomyces pijperi]|uniref:Uncharacterized protein n=1 Tax=Wickerhamomyces pijperi TaxID=599730 RepID=A0A9P8TKD1_WICPI|nr:hypothetical protein WICPIJ_006272 [Wickerhamomyces pijperi]
MFGDVTSICASMESTSAFVERSDVAIDGKDTVESFAVECVGMNDSLSVAFFKGVDWNLLLKTLLKNPVVLPLNCGDSCSARCSLVPAWSCTLSPSRLLSARECCPSVLSLLLILSLSVLDEALAASLEDAEVEMTSREVVCGSAMEDLERDGERERVRPAVEVDAFKEV